MSEIDKKKAALKETVARINRRIFAKSKLAGEYEANGAGIGVPLVIADVNGTEMAAELRLEAHTLSEQRDRKQAELDQLA